MNEAKRNEESSLTELLYGEFKPDKRIAALEDRLALYYERTPTEMCNKDAAYHWREFMEWCRDHDFTRAEINMAKKSPRFKDV